MKQTKRYGLPILTNYGWQVIGKMLIVIGLVGLAVLQLGATTP